MSKERCHCCDKKVKVMAFKGTGVCSNVCRKAHKRHTEESSAVHPSNGHRPPMRAEDLSAEDLITLARNTGCTIQQAGDQIMVLTPSPIPPYSAHRGDIWHGVSGDLYQWDGHSWRKHVG